MIHGGHLRTVHLRHDDLVAETARGRLAARAHRPRHAGPPATEPRKDRPMRRIWIALSCLLALAGAAGISQGYRATAAQDATPAAGAAHPFVGTWVVDTSVGSETDPPEIAIVTPDGRLAGLGANRVAGGTWEAVDADTALLTLVTVSDAAGVGGYAVIRGLHEIDATGDAWTCECTVTVVAADGAVLDSLVDPASAERLPIQGPEMAGDPLAEVPVWRSATGD